MRLVDFWFDILNYYSNLFCFSFKCDTADLLSSLSFIAQSKKRSKREVLLHDKRARMALVQGT